MRELNINIGVLETAVRKAAIEELKTCRETIRQLTEKNNKMRGNLIRAIEFGYKHGKGNVTLDFIVEAFMKQF
jgi:hypothetical protein